MHVLLAAVCAAALAAAPIASAERSKAYSKCAAGQYAPDGFGLTTQVCVPVVTPEDESTTVTSVVECVPEMSRDGPNTGRSTVVSLSLDGGTTRSCLHSVIYLDNGEALHTKEDAAPVAGDTGFFTTVQEIATAHGLLKSELPEISGLTLTGDTHITCDSTATETDVGIMFALKETTRYYIDGAGQGTAETTIKYFEVVCRSDRNSHAHLSWHISLPTHYVSSNLKAGGEGVAEAGKIGNGNENRFPAGSSLVVTMHTPDDTDDATRLAFIAFGNLYEFPPEISANPISTGYLYNPQDDVGTDKTDLPFAQIWAGPPGHRSRQQYTFTFGGSDLTALTTLPAINFEIVPYDRLGRRLMDEDDVVIGNAAAGSAAWYARLPEVYKIPTCDCDKSLSDTTNVREHTFLPIHMDRFTWHCGETGADALCSPAGVAYSPTRAHMWALIAASIDSHHRCICSTKNKRMDANGRIKTLFSMANKHKVFGSTVRYTWTDEDLKYYGTVRTKRGVLVPDSYNRVRARTDKGIDVSDGYEMEIEHGFRMDYAFVNSRGLPGISLHDSIHDTTTTVITAEGNTTVVLPVYGTGILHTDHYKGKLDWQMIVAIVALSLAVLNTLVSGYNAWKMNGLSGNFFVSAVVRRGRNNNPYQNIGPS